MSNHDPETNRLLRQLQQTQRSQSNTMTCCLVIIIVLLTPVWVPVLLALLAFGSI